MDPLLQIIDFLQKAVLVIAFFSGLTVVLSMLMFLATAATTNKSTTAKRKHKSRFAAGNGGRTLGRASASDLSQARMARLEQNRKQKQAIVKKQKEEATNAKKRELSPSQRKPLHMRNRHTYSSTFRNPPPSPTSVTKVPLELQVESTQHFFLVGATKFIALPPMDQMDIAVSILKRLSQEFMPIIHRRGFNIRSVSELCCCGDGLEYELGGERRSVPAGEAIVGNDHDSVAGYNGKLMDRFGKPEHVIHLRLRQVCNHDLFMDYHEIVDTMAHELAHCVHEDHSPAFWDLMEEILKEREAIVEDLKQGRSTMEYDPVQASKKQFGGFDIYQSVSGQMRNYNGQLYKM